MVFYDIAAKQRNVRLAQIKACLTAFGVILKRLIISVIAFKWYDPASYYPVWQESGAPSRS